MRHSPRLPPDLPAAVEASAEALIVLWGRAQEALGTHASAPQLRVLLIVARAGPLTINGLAEHLGAIPSSTSRLCDRLEAAGLLVRSTGEHDRREVSVSLTTAGGNLLAELGRRRRDDLAAILARMTPTSQAALLEGLTAFRAAAEDAGEYNELLA
ncbi:MarR family winged helix-turn-helix transcriptional regulator [Actinomadura craniellae]|nr:MarR family transcriptional regulator [Actinomadura craniellae]